MTITKIIANANKLADENVQQSIAKEWVVDAIAKIAINWPLVMPLPDLTDLDFEIRFTKDITLSTSPTNVERKRKAILDTANDNIIRLLVVPYVVYQIKKNDGSQFEYMDTLDEWTSNLIRIRQQYEKLINPAYLLEDFDVDGDGLNVISNIRVAVPKQEHMTYSPKNTFADNVEDAEVSSTNKWGE